jgi:hypothetical protein
MKIVFKDENVLVQEAVDKSNELLSGTVLFDHIRSKGSFDSRYTNTTSAIIADLIQTSKLEFIIELFYPTRLIDKVRYRKTFAYTDGNFPNTLFLNLKKLNRSYEDIAGTIIHESIHAIDDEQLLYSFGHGDNSPSGKDDTAPYWIGNEAIKILTGDPLATITFDVDENDDYPIAT